MAVIAPLEMYCFPMFSEGGRFYYEGFGFGSFIFAIIAWQVIGYDLIAIVAIPLGYGNLKRKGWARPLTVTVLWSWLILGAPLMLIIGFMAVAFKDPSEVMTFVIFPLLGLMLYPILPALLVRFYNSERVRQVFAHKNARAYDVESIPLPIQVLGFLFIFYLIALHLPFFFNGIFPVFGTWFSEMPGMWILDGAILSLAFLTWGTLRRQRWAWWGDMAYFGLLTISTIITLTCSSITDILSLTHLAPIERQALQGMPIQGWHIAVFIGLPLLLTWGLIVYAKRYFTRNSSTNS
ncbi:MAG: hypothetical protein JXA33_24490 [Anaerolineae bacterium]|nr:hypothetical protein [Anaerolineae bacterium]